jgi:PAS domain-containing protein
VTRNPELAAWLVCQRRQIEQAMAARLGPAAPGPAAPESEVLRRFRSFAAAALHRGANGAAPALDGLKANERRVTAVLSTWSEAAADLAGRDGEVLRSALEPLIARFRASMRTTGAGRRASGAPRAGRRAVTAAIDRVSDSFLAIDADSGRIVDANPAAGALLGVARDALLDVEAMSFVPAPARNLWWTHLDAVTEGSEPHRFTADLRDAGGATFTVDCTITCFATRRRTLALILARPL